ncbi:HAMP domain-containing sensor histidine kinase [Sorangium sp. So ce136]|uniref:sensor histidine kinase n=1 Tax=Sorangium sp. So ce136 TaxID=3133284 RepID=UPI003F03C2E0
MLIEIGRNGRVVFANASAREVAFAYEDLDGQTPQVTDADGKTLAPHERPRSRALRGEAFGPSMTHWKTRDGDVALVVRCDTVDEGERRLAALTFVDVTAFHRWTDDSRAALAARDEFLSIAAHELRSPLNALMLTIHRLKLRIPADGSFPEFDRLVDMSQRQIDRLTSLVQNLLDVTRIRARRLELEFESKDLLQIVRDAAEEAIEHARAAGTPVRIEAREPVFGLWDGARIEQVVQNLLTNALKYGGGSPIEVSVEREGATAKLTVRDQGPGIAAEDRDRVFEPFQRIASTYKSQSLGLGLYIVREIVQAHGGSIVIEAPDSGGAAFVVRLPVAQQQQQQSSETSAEQA